MPKIQWFLAVSIVLLIAIVARFLYLGDIPHGITWDEAAIGYNGHAVVSTRRDEWLEKLPVSFRSFGDYKAPLAIYISGIFTFIFGLNPFSLRLPFALAGVASVVVWFFILSHLFTLFYAQEKNGALSIKIVSLLGALLFAVSPWHMHFSRAGFESGLSLFCILLAVALFAWGVQMKQSGKQLLLYCLSSLAASASMYAYHSAKIVLPLLMLILAVFFMSRLLRSKKNVFIALCILIISLLPLLNDSIFGNGLERAGVSVFSQELPLSEKLTIFLNNMALHLSWDFLLMGETTTLRHAGGGWGVLQLTTYVAVLYGFFKTFFLLIKKNKNYRVGLFFLLWLVIGIVPAAIGTEVPHSNRALLALPGFIGLAVFGISVAYSDILEIRHFDVATRKLLANAFFGTFLTVHLLVSAAYFHYYFTDFAAQSADSFADGYLEALAIAREYEYGMNGKPKVGQIFVTPEYGQPYIFILFSKKISPIEYQGGLLSQKYHFFGEISEGDLQRSNSLLISSSKSPLPIESATHLVYGSDGSLRFKLYYVP